MLKDFATPGLGVRTSRQASGGFRRQEPEPHAANHTPLREAIIAANKAGGDVYACPFGCPEEAYDEHWYCRHLVGFTDDPALGYEPLVTLPTGKRQVQTRTVGTGKHTKIVREPCRPGDHVEWLSDWGWGWVYRPDAPPPAGPDPFAGDPDDDIEDEADLDAAIAREQAASNRE